MEAPVQLQNAAICRRLTEVRNGYGGFTICERR